MFPRIKSYKNKDGTLRHYLFLVDNKRIGAHVRQVTRANFGRVEDLDKVIPDVVEKLSKFTRKLKVLNLAKDIKADWVKEYGAVIVFKRIWDRLGLGRYFERYLEERRITFDAVGIIFTMVLNRLLEPRSELGARKWVESLYGIKDIGDLHQWYRALDFLIEHKDELEVDLYEADRDLFNQETPKGYPMVLMDTTSVVYFGDGEKAEDILDYGYSKEKRKREEIIARLIEKLKAQGLKSLLVHREYSKYLKIKAEKPELDEEKVKAEELFDGKFVLQTNTKLDWREIVLSYKDLWQVEAAFRTLKSELEVGPIYHYTERRIRAHIFVCFLALLSKVVFEKELLKLNENLKFSGVLQDIRKVKAVQITLKGKPIILRTELEGDAHFAFKAAGLKIPPRLLSEPPHIQEIVVLRHQESP
jgi:hypothetical protein